MNLDHDFFQVSKSSEDQTKKVFTKTGTLFSPNSSGDLRSDAHRSQIFGGMQMKTILKLLGRIQSSYWGDISPHPLRVLAPLRATKHKTEKLTRW